MEPEWAREARERVERNAAEMRRQQERQRDLQDRERAARETKEVAAKAQREAERHNREMEALLREGSTPQDQPFRQRDRNESSQVTIGDTPTSGGWVFKMVLLAGLCLLVLGVWSRGIFPTGDTSATSDEAPVSNPYRDSDEIPQRDEIASQPQPTERLSDEAGPVEETRVSDDVQKDGAGIETAEYAENGAPVMRPTVSPQTSEKLARAFDKAFESGRPVRWRDGPEKGYVVPSEADPMTGCRNLSYSIDTLGPNWRSSIQKVCP